MLLNLLGNHDGYHNDDDDEDESGDDANYGESATYIGIRQSVCRLVCSNKVVSFTEFTEL